MRTKLAIAAFAALALSSCADNDGPPPGAGAETGGAHPVDAIAARSDTLLISAFTFTTEQGPVRIDSDCTGTVCRLTSAGLDERIDLRGLAGDVPSGEPGVWPPAATETYRGVSLVTVTEIDPNTGELKNFGAWMHHGFFFAGGGVITDEGETITFPLAAFIGDAAGTNPVSGSASWAGVMIGAEEGETIVKVRGDADLTADFASASVDVAFTKIADDARRGAGQPPLDRCSNGGRALSRGHGGEQD